MFTCKICLSSCQTWEELAEHMRRHLEPGVEKPKNKSPNDRLIFRCLWLILRILLDHYQTTPLFCLDDAKPIIKDLERAIGL